MKNMKKTKLLTYLVGIILALTLVNLYGTFDLYGKIGSINEKIIAESGETKAETRPTTTFIVQEPQQQQPSRIQEVSADDDPVKGSENAPITMIEFSDFQCPFCARYFKQTFPLIEKNYIKTGKIKYVYRDFPLSFHNYAQKAAEAAECARDQEKFWGYHDLLFQSQDALDIASLKVYAEELNLDTKKFNDCLDSDKYEEEVKKDFQDGQRYGVSGTPTFFINGVKIVGARPYSAFEEIIEQELSQMSV
jgi:protein-disulfide isomerase